MHWKDGDPYLYLREALLRPIFGFALPLGREKNTYSARTSELSFGSWALSAVRAPAWPWEALGVGLREVSLEPGGDCCGPSCSDLATTLAHFLWAEKQHSPRARC